MSKNDDAQTGQDTGGAWPRRAWAAVRAWTRHPNVRLVAKTVALCLLAVATSPWWVALYRILLYGAALDQAIILCSTFIIRRIIIARRRWQHHDDDTAVKDAEERGTHERTRTHKGRGDTDDARSAARRRHARKPGRR